MEHVHGTCAAASRACESCRPSQLMRPCICICTMYMHHVYVIAQVNSRGFDAAAMKTVPGFNLVASKLRGIYFWFKEQLRQKCCGRALDTFVERAWMDRAHGHVHMHMRHCMLPCAP